MMSCTAEHYALKVPTYLMLLDYPFRYVATGLQYYTGDDPVQDKLEMQLQKTRRRLRTLHFPHKIILLDRTSALQS
jgi:hypothetical protein